MYKWFLTWRYLHTKLIAFFAIASVTLCVAMVLVVLSVMGGFLDTVRARSRGLHSEIVLQGRTLQGFPYYAEFGQHLTETMPQTVRLCTPVLFTYGIFRVPATTYTKATQVLGIRLDEYVQVNDFGAGLHYDRYYPGSTHLARQRLPVAGIAPGDKLVLPEALEEANAIWRAGETDAEAITRFDQLPFAWSIFPSEYAEFPGERVYALDVDGPGYAGPEYAGLIAGVDLLYDRREDGNFDRYLARGAVVTLTLLPLTSSGNLKGETPVKLPLRYADDSRTGIYEIDSQCVYVDFDRLQHELAMDPQPLVDGGMSQARASQLFVGLQDGLDLDAARDRIEAAWVDFLKGLGNDLRSDDLSALEHVTVETWEDIQRHFIAAVEKEKVLVTFLFGLISIVAIVLVGCIFYMIVEKKTKDIGILKALGASRRGVAAMFIAYAGAVGVVGSLLGTLIGSLFVWNINSIQD